jgi:hypothetical protein
LVRLRTACRRRRAPRGRLDLSGHFKNGRLVGVFGAAVAGPRRCMTLTPAGPHLDRVPDAVWQQIIELALSPRVPAARSTGAKAILSLRFGYTQLLKAHDLITSPNTISIRPRADVVAGRGRGAGSAATITGANSIRLYLTSRPSRAALRQAKSWLGYEGQQAQKRATTAPIATKNPGEPGRTLHQGVKSPSIATRSATLALCGRGRPTPVYNQFIERISSICSRHPNVAATRSIE